MRIKSLAAAAVLGVSALALSGCETGFPTQVSRYQAMAAPQGQTFFVVSDNPQRQGSLEFNHVAPAIHACVAGLGPGAFMSYQVAPFVSRRELRIVLERFEPPPQPVNVVYPHARLLPARTRRLIDWLTSAELPVA